MENRKKGSALILVIVIMSLVSVLGSIMMYNATLLHDVALQRVQAIQQTHALQGLLSYGIAQCKELDVMRNLLPSKEREKIKEYTYSFDHWLHTPLGYSGKLIITAQDNIFSIKADLIKNNKHLIASCKVIKGDKEWTIEY